MCYLCIFFLKGKYQFVVLFVQHLSIPSAGAAHSHVFNFSLAPTAQAEEGTFDCLRSQGGRSLHAVGSLSHQMWIQANDDVYETTRHRMAVAEEMSKKNWYVFGFYLIVVIILFFCAAPE